MFESLDKYVFPEFTGWLLAVKIFVILFDVGVIAFIIFVWVTTNYARKLWWWDVKEFFTYRSYHIRRIDQEWNKIKKRLLLNKESEFKLAVMEADLLVTDTMGRQGFMGATMADKLDAAKPGSLSDVAAMKEADQVYQNLIVDPGYSLDYQTAKKIILTFEQALKDIKAFTGK